MIKTNYFKSYYLTNIGQLLDNIIKKYVKLKNFTLLKLISCQISRAITKIISS